MAYKPKVKLGEVTVVKNKKKYISASKEYYTTYILLRGVKIPIMMTSSDLRRLEKRAKKNPEDLPKLLE